MDSSAIISQKSLDRCEPGSEVRIVKINAGKGAALNLNGLGLHPGNRVAVVRKTIMGGPIIVSHRGTQVAIGKGLARKILVEEIA